VLLCPFLLKDTRSNRERGIWGTPSTADLGNIAPQAWDKKVGSADVKPKKRKLRKPTERQKEERV